MTAINFPVMSVITYQMIVVTFKRHHLIEHEGFRYTCNNCEFEAKCHSSLKSHCLRQHKGITFSCDKCDHQSITLSSLDLHRKFKHKEPNICKYCKSVFKTSPKLRRHLESVHEGLKYPCSSVNTKQKMGVILERIRDICTKA